MLQILFKVLASLGSFPHLSELTLQTDAQFRSLRGAEVIAEMTTAEARYHYYSETHEPAHWGHLRRWLGQHSSLQALTFNVRRLFTNYDAHVVPLEELVGWVQEFIKKQLAEWVRLGIAQVHVAVRQKLFPSDQH